MQLKRAAVLKGAPYNYIFILLRILINAAENKNHLKFKSYPRGRMAWVLFKVIENQIFYLQRLEIKSAVIILSALASIGTCPSTSL